MSIIYPSRRLTSACKGLLPNSLRLLHPFEIPIVEFSHNKVLFVLFHQNRVICYLLQIDHSSLVSLLPPLFCERSCMQMHEGDSGATKLGEQNRNKPYWHAPSFLPTLARLVPSHVTKRFF